MREKLLAAAAIGALLTSPAFAQDGGAGAMTQQDIQELGETFEQAGFTGFRPVTGGDVFRGMSAGGNAAVIAVAPEMGNTAADAGTSADAAGTGMAGAEIFQVTTAGGHTLYVVVRPEMTGMTTAGTTTTGDATESGTTTAETQTAEKTGDNDNDGDTAETTTTAENAETTTGGETGGSQAVTMNVELTGAEQVPPVETSGSGKVDVTFNSETRELSWELDYSDLSSDATAAHFHGPADPGETAPPVVPLEDFSDGAEGSATLTEGQAEQLMAGKWYFNLHTENNPNGEIRGQVTAVQ